MTICNQSGYYVIQYLLPPCYLHGPIDQCPSVLTVLRLFVSYCLEFDKCLKVIQ